jgi:hypothetical protein
MKLMIDLAVAVIVLDELRVEPVKAEVKFSLPDKST